MNKLLIVDDSSTMRQIIMRVVRQADIQVQTILEAGSATEALAQLQTHPDVDVVLSDMNMPQMGGVELLRRIRESRAAEELPMFLLTTEEGGSVGERVLADGANGYLCKPFTAVSFSEALRPYAG